MFENNYPKTDQNITKRPITNKKLLLINTNLKLYLKCVFESLGKTNNIKNKFIPSSVELYLSPSLIDICSLLDRHCFHFL